MNKPITQIFRIETGDIGLRPKGICRHLSAATIDDAARQFADNRELRGILGDRQISNYQELLDAFESVGSSVKINETRTL